MICSGGKVHVKYEHPDLMFFYNSKLESSFQKGEVEKH